MEVSLYDILNARETRARLQQQLLLEYGCPIICFTMNIAGPIKTSPLIQRGFQAGIAALEQQIPHDAIQKQVLDSANTGNTAMYAIQMDALELKNICTNIEESHPLGRLFDMDVISIDGTKLERRIQRGCIICKSPGRVCASRRLHPVAELQKTTTGILTDYFAEIDRECIAAKAVQSLIDEVNTTPKPGLVDMRNNGSHKDMTLEHFIVSAYALRPYFVRCVRIGQQNRHLPAEDVFPLLRQAGIEAENRMYEATNGINTHKGIIYTLGVLCCSIGRHWHSEHSTINRTDILSECIALVRSSVETDFKSANGNTAGEQAYLKYGIGGIRAEVAAGLPSVAKLALPCFEKALQDGLSCNDAGCVALLHLIAQINDTNLYHRGGQHGAMWAATAANSLLNTNTYPSTEEICKLDDAFIARNLSPGGCADLLAVTYFLHSLQ